MYENDGLIKAHDGVKAASKRGHILSKTDTNKTISPKNPKKSFRVLTLAITISDTNTAICGCVRGCARHFGGCARQKSPFGGDNLHFCGPQPRPQHIFLNSRSNSFPISETKGSARFYSKPSCQNEQQQQQQL